MTTSDVTMRTRALLFAALTTGLLACGSSATPADATPTSTSDGPPGSPPDAMITNALGRVCGGGHPACPAGNACVLFPFGSQTQGVCGPLCHNDSQICSVGYEGPSGGTPVCDTQVCTIDCNGHQDGCPAPLRCEPDVESL